MNKEVKFSRFVGIAIVIIAVWIVVLALMSAILKNENNDNMIYVDEGKGIKLSIPKSNIISNDMDIQKDVEFNENMVELDVRLPKINIDTQMANNINDNIYKLYQEVYSKALNDNNIEKIEMDYTYKYLENDTIVEIVVITKIKVNNKIEQIENKFIYDIMNDKEIVK